MDDIGRDLAALYAMEELKNAPEWQQNMNLLLLCRMDPTGIMEPIARILAEYSIPPEKIVPCIMDIMAFLVKKTAADKIKED